MNWHQIRRDAWSGMAGIAGWNIGHGDFAAALFFICVVACLVAIDSMMRDTIAKGES